MTPALAEGASAVCLLINKGNGRYLSCASAPFKLVDLCAGQDGSGRQMWLLQDQPDGDFCTIRVYDGRGSDSCTYLTVGEAAGVELAILSDTLDRQTWYLDDILGDGTEIVVRLATARVPGEGCVLSRDPLAAGGNGVTLVPRVHGDDQKWAVFRVPERNFPKECTLYPPVLPVPAPNAPPPPWTDDVTIQAIKQRVHDRQAQLRGRYTVWDGPDGRKYLVWRKEDRRVLDVLVRLNGVGAALTAAARANHGADHQFVRRLGQLFETDVSHVGDLNPSVWAAGICWNGSENVAWIGLKLEPADSWCWTVYYFLHEVSHCLGSWSHGDRFYASFRWCLRTAAAAGLWNYSDLNMLWQWEPADNTYGSFCPYRDEDYEAIVDALHNPPLDLIKRYPAVFAPSPYDVFFEEKIL